MYIKTPFLALWTNESSHSNLLLDSDLIDINNDGYDDLVVGFGHGSASRCMFSK